MRLLLLIVAITGSMAVSAQVGIGVNHANIDPSAQLEVSSTSKGILVPRMTSSQRTGISNPATGLLVYQTDSPIGFYYFTKGNWKILGEQDITVKLNISDTTEMLSGYARVQRMLDSLNRKLNIADTSSMLDNRFARDTASLSNRIDEKLNIADTSSMLDNRFARDTASLSNRIDAKLNISDTASMLDSRFAKDTVSLSDRINTNKQAIIDTASNLRSYADLKVNIADTASMLDNRFARDTASLSNRIDEKLNITDTASMLDNRFARDTATLSARIDDKLNIADTANMLSSYLRSSDTANMLDNRFARDTASLSNRIDKKLNIADTSSMLDNRFARDTALLSNRIDEKLNITDTASMLDNRFARDTASLSARIDNKLNIADTTNMLSSYLRSSDTSSMLSNRFARDTASLSARIDDKLNISDTSTMLDNRFARDTASLSARIDDKLNISDTSTMLDNRFARDTASLSSRIDEKLNNADTANMLSSYLRSSDTSSMLSNRFARDTASLSSRINLKLIISDTATMLSSYLKSVDTSSLSRRIDSLRPLSSGDIVYGGTNGDPTRLPIGNDGQVLTLNNGLLVWAANNGVTTVGPISATATVTGAYIASNTLYLAPADADNAGIVSTATQTFAGEKTFNSDLTVNGKITSSNTDRSTFAGKLTVGTNSDTTSSAILEASSTTQGFLPPRLTTTQRDAITTPVAGLTIWNATNTQLEVYDGSYWKNMVGLLVSPLNVGDTYGGGKVFYIFGPSDNGFIKGQTHGLIAATEDQTTDAGVKWFPNEFYGATGTYIGLGLPNTLAIITSAIVTGTTNMSSFAAGLANSYRGGGYIDWFLPSKDELNLLYQARDAIGGFATSGIPGYWSSTQKGGISFTNFTSFATGVTNARIQFFYTGGTPVQPGGTITDTGIGNVRRVRAIRIF